MKKMVALVLCASTVPAWSADVTVGFGISAESNDSTIYVPIDFGRSWRLEPFVNFSKVKQDEIVTAETLRIGTGVFKLQSIAESFHVYFGGRLGYQKAELAQYSTEWRTIYDESEGFRVAPTLGLEYAFTEHLSLGGEAEWFYEEHDLGGQRKQSRTGTDTRLIFRFRF